MKKLPAFNHLPSLLLLGVGLCAVLETPQRAWAVRIRPVRKTAAGQEWELKGLLQALENSSLNDLNKAIDTKDNAAFSTAYRQTLEGCSSCLQAAEKPFLRAQIPHAPATRIIRLSPEPAPQR